jgi:hypothetical protein
MFAPALQINELGSVTHQRVKNDMAGFAWGLSGGTDAALFHQPQADTNGGPIASGRARLSGRWAHYVRDALLRQLAIARRFIRGEFQALRPESGGPSMGN